jgi:hypothetical protein
MDCDAGAANSTRGFVANAIDLDARAGGSLLSPKELLVDPEFIAILRILGRRRRRLAIERSVSE